MALLAILQGFPQKLWCIECRGWGMVVMLIFWALILILITYLVWFFFRILGGHGTRRWPWGRRRPGPGNEPEGGPRYEGGESRYGGRESHDDLGSAPGQAEHEEGRDREGPRD